MPCYMDEMSYMDEMDGGALFGPSLPSGLKKGCRRGYKISCAKKNQTPCLKYVCKRKASKKSKKSKKSKVSKRSKRARVSGRIIPVSASGRCPPSYRKRAEVHYVVSGRTYGKSGKILKKGRRVGRKTHVCVRKLRKSKRGRKSRKSHKSAGKCSGKTLKQLRRIAKRSGVKQSYKGKPRSKAALTRALKAKGAC